MKKNIIILLFLAFAPFYTNAQFQKITLEEAIKRAQKKSIDYEIALNRYKRSYWAFRNYKARFLPQLGLNSTLPNYSEEIALIQLDNGNPDFARRNQIQTDFNLSLRQNVAFTGGTFSVGSSINRIDILNSETPTNYFFTPFIINYRQNSIFYNRFKWDKKIEPLKYDQSQKRFLENMEAISSKACRLYFNLLKTQIKIKIGNNNLSNQDTLLKISKGRYKVGKIAENELLQMELTYLKSKNNLTNDSITLKRTSQDLALFLDIETENLELLVPEKLNYFAVDLKKALREAKENRRNITDLKIQKLEAEKELARIRGSNKLNIDINARLGRSRSSNDFDDLLSNFNKQQGVSVGISMPILDWGVSTSARKRAESNLNLANSEIKQSERNFEQDIEYLVLNWSNQTGLLKISEKAQQIAIKSYEIAKQRYILGKITITDLNIAQANMDNANIEYLNSLQSFWNDYYRLRQFTLYDFMEDKKLTTEDILFI